MDCLRVVLYIHHLVPLHTHIRLAEVSLKSYGFPRTPADPRGNASLLESIPLRPLEFSRLAFKRPDFVSCLRMKLTLRLPLLVLGNSSLNLS